MKKQKIIIIGAGYGGLKAVEQLAKSKKAEILLFDKHPYHYMQTEVYDFIANENDFAKITIDLFTFCHGFDDNVTFYKEEVIHIETKNKKIITNLQRYSYDYLIIASGATTNLLDSVKGLKEYSHGVKSLKRALYFKQKFELSLFNKIEEEGKQCTPLNIVVAGGGLSGVEIAAQMASFSNEFYKNNHFLCRKLNIVIVNSGEKILKGVDNRLVTQSINRLEKLGVLIKNSCRVSEVRKDEVILSDKEVLPIDFMIFTGGIKPTPLVESLEMPKDKRGFLQSNEYLQCLGYSDVFAIGDCTSIKDSMGNSLAPTADISEQMGILSANNILSLIDGKKLKKHNISSRGLLIAIGRKYTVGKLFGLYFKGYSAYILKKLVEKVYAKRLAYISYKGCKKIFS